jgi:uncharacterized protein (TIGR02266 family)
MKHRRLTGEAEQRPFEARFSTLDRSTSSSGLHAQRRHAPRYRVDLDVSLGSDHNFYAGLAENMSAGGVFVATHLLKPVGEIVQLTIHLPESNATVRCTGEVRWIREYAERSELPPGMGIRFLDPDDALLHAVAGFLSTREPMFFDE